MKNITKYFLVLAALLAGGGNAHGMRPNAMNLRNLGAITISTLDRPSNAFIKLVKALPLPFPKAQHATIRPQTNPVPAVQAIFREDEAAARIAMLMPCDYEGNSIMQAFFNSALIQLPNPSVIVVNSAIDYSHINPQPTGWFINGGITPLLPILFGRMREETELALAKFMSEKPISEEHEARKIEFCGLCTSHLGENSGNFENSGDFEDIQEIKLKLERALVQGANAPVLVFSIFKQHGDDAKKAMLLPDNGTQETLLSRLCAHLFVQTPIEPYNPYVSQQPLAQQTEWTSNTTNLSVLYAIFPFMKHDIVVGVRRAFVPLPAATKIKLLSGFNAFFAQ